MRRKCSFKHNIKINLEILSQTATNLSEQRVFVQEMKRGPPKR
jgi:hypothetical protein